MTAVLNDEAARLSTRRALRTRLKRSVSHRSVDRGLLLRIVAFRSGRCLPLLGRRDLDATPLDNGAVKGSNRLCHRADRREIDNAVIRDRSIRLAMKARPQDKTEIIEKFSQLLVGERSRKTTYRNVALLVKTHGSVL